MSGLKMTDVELALPSEAVTFAVRYEEVLRPDGVSDQGPVDDEFDPSGIFAQAGSLKSLIA